MWFIFHLRGQRAEQTVQAVAARGQRADTDALHGAARADKALRQRIGLARGLQHALVPVWAIDVQQALMRQALPLSQTGVVD
ncbi:MAG: hypothetical protein Q3Y08_09740, partial [Butyricicoccus sp.]|nr:hypothetical protein [Butyricicoccus sp.]